MLSGHGGGGIDEFDNQLNDPNQYDNPQDPASLSVAEHLCALTIRGKLVLVYIVGLLLCMLWMLDWVSVYRLSGRFFFLWRFFFLVCFVSDSASLSESLRSNTAYS